MGYIKENEDTTHQVLRFTGVGGDSGVSPNSYAIYQEGGAWTNPYPDLVIAYHTGIKIGAYAGYGGTRFYNDSPGKSGSTEIFSVGNGDNHVRVLNNLIVTGTVTASGGDSGNWNTAHGWGNHASAGYKTTDNNTQLTTAQVRGKISASGNSQYNATTGVITSTNTNTQRSDEDITAVIVKEGFLTALPSHNHDTLYLGKTAKAADSESVDGIDSSRIVYGGNSKRSTRYDGVGIANPNQNSGFYYGSAPDGGPSTDWTNWLTVAGGSWSSGNNYDFKLAHVFHSDNFYVSRMTNGSQGAWRLVIDSGNIGSQSVDNASKLDGIDSSQFMRSDANDVGSGSYSFSNSYNEFGNGYASVSNDGNWNGRVNIAGSSHARLDVKSVSDGIITTMYAHTGHGAGRIGTMSSHPIQFMTGGETRGQVNAKGVLHMAGDIVGFWDFSDRRLKTNIKPLENNLEKVMSLHPVSYQWKSGERKGKTNIGLIAQEVEEIVPEVVRDQERLEDGSTTTYKTVDYEHLVSVLIGAVQEQQEQINNLKLKMCTCHGK
jgi:hypothetical protein